MEKWVIIIIAIIIIIIIITINIIYLYFNDVFWNQIFKLGSNFFFFLRHIDLGNTGTIHFQIKNKSS